MAILPPEIRRYLVGSGFLGIFWNQTRVRQNRILCSRKRVESHSEHVVVRSSVGFHQETKAASNLNTDQSFRIRPFPADH